MAIAYRSSGTFVAANSTSSGAIGLPAGLADGDTMTLVVQARGGGTITTPSGYTRAAQVNITKGHRLAVYYKYVTNAAGEAAPSVTQSASGLICGRISAFSGCNATTQLDVAATSAKHTDLATVTAPSITPVSAGTMAVWCFSTGDDNTLNAATQGTTAYSSDTTTGADGSIALVYELQTTAAATGTCAMTESANGPDNWNTITLALRPSAVSTADPTRALGFDSITYAVEIAFGGSPFAPDPTWTDVSAYVRASEGIVVARGRNSEFSDIQPGTMTLTLDNRTRLFDPDYTAGTYHGQLLPQTRIRLRARKDSTNYPIFDGYILTFGQAYVAPREAVVNIDAVDIFGRLAARKVPPSLLSTVILADGPYAYFPLTDDQNRTVSEISGSGWSAFYSPVVQTAPSILPGEPEFNCKRVETFTNQATLAPFFNATGTTVENVMSIEIWTKVGEVVAGAASTFLLSFGAVATSNALEVGIISVGTDAAAAVPFTSGGASRFYAFANAYSSAFAQTLGYQYAIQAQQFVHIVGTLDSAFTLLSTYVNGQLIGTVDVSAVSFEGGTFPNGITPYVGAVNGEMFIAHGATYERELTATEILEHYHTGVTGGNLQTAPARMDQIADFVDLNAAGMYDDSDFAANTYLGYANLSGTALSIMQNIIRTEQGRLFVDAAGVIQAQGRTADMKTLAVNATVQATLSDSGTYAYKSPDGVEIQTGDIDLIKNTIYVSAGGGTIVTADEPSRSLYDEREESISAELDDASAARNLGLSRLRRYKDPTTRINHVHLVPHGTSDVRYTLCFTVDLGWRLTVTRTPQAIGSAISKTVSVEGITHTITDANWLTTLYLAPAQATYTAQPWFVFGDATFGRFGAAAANQLSY